MAGNGQSYRVIQISDTHLHRDAGWSGCVENFKTIADVVGERDAHLVVNTGDIALDGAGNEDDLAFARDCHDALGAPVRAIPGNHDLGDNHWIDGVKQPITTERLERYRRHFGADYWLVEAGSWALVGLNAQLLGSGLAAEEAQWNFLRDALSGAAKQPVALFIHKPLFNEAKAETEVNHRYVAPTYRHRLFEAFRGTDLRLVASGHVHQHRHRHIEGIDYCWGPSTAFTVPDRIQPHIGTKRLGYIAYEFRPDGVGIDVVEGSTMTHYSLDDFPAYYGGH